MHAFTMPPIAMVDDASIASFSVKEGNDETAKVPHSPRRMIARRHSITFSGENTVHEFDNTGEENREEIWYSKDEYDIIKARNKLIVKMKKTGKFEENEEHSFRGLEHKLKEGFDQRRSNKFNALNAVLEEQDHQYARGLLNADNIAQKYERAVHVARETAFFLALKDAEETCIRNMSPKSVLVVDDDDFSIVSDLGTVCTEDTVQKKMRLKHLFGGLSSYRKKNKSCRRASM